MPSFCRISTEKTFKFNKKNPVYKLPRGAIYEPPCLQLINSPFFAIHQVFALSIKTSFATPAAPYRSLPGPPGPESRKSLQRVSRHLPAPGSKKCPKQSKNSLRSLETVYFETPETVSRLFRTLFGPRGRKAPGDFLGTLPEPQNSQSDYFYCLTLSGRLFFFPFSLMKFVWWSWASGYQTNLSLRFVGKTTPRLIWCGKIVLSDKKFVARQFFFCILEVLGFWDSGPGGPRRLL